MPSDRNSPQAPVRTQAEQHKLRQRNRAVLWALVGWCAIVFAVAIVKMSGSGVMH